ncbi:MAG: hypothetical protein VB050_03295 [Geobacteraceae bacterium]|nr:hypothetical protein [Geobacteraceae bacterium]
MTLKNRLITALFGGVVKEQVEQRLQTAVDERVLADLPKAVAEKLQAASVSLDRNYGWRLLNGQNTRELLLAPYETQILTAYYLYKTNPLAEFLINTPAAFVATGDFPYTCENEDVKTLLQAFWDRNRMELRWGNYIQELGVFANIVLTAHKAEQTGRVKIGYIDPGLILTTIADPQDVQTKIGVVVKADNFSTDERTLKVILDGDTEEDLSDDAKRLRAQMTDGECFLLQINCMSSELLGTSDLFNVADHLDTYEQMMMDSGEKFAQFNAFYYDIEVQGADAKELEDHRAHYTPPRTGGAFIHNDKVKSEAIAPDLKAADTETATRYQRRHILGAKCIPNHWYADPEGSNRATAAEMDRPTLKRFERRQKEITAFLKTMADFVVTSALEASYLKVPEEEAYSYEISFPPLTDKDVAKISTMLAQVAAALTTAQVQGWMDQQQAARMFAFCVDMLGYKYDPDEQEPVEPGYDDYLKMGGQPKGGGQNG